MAATKFSEFAGGWQFCGPVLLQGRIERVIALASSESEKALVARMVTQFWKEYREDREKILARGMDVTALDVQIAHATERYVGPPHRDGRFQIIESLVPAGTYYIVDHKLLDLLVREDGPASAIARFPSIHDAENRIRDIMGVTYKKTEKPPMDGIGERQLKELRAKRKLEAAALSSAPDSILSAPDPAPAPALSEVEMVETVEVDKPVWETPTKPRRARKLKVVETVAPEPESEPVTKAKRQGERKIAGSISATGHVRKRAAKTPEPAEKPKRSWVNRKPKPSMRFRELIMEGKLTDLEIFTRVQEEFGREKVSDASKGYVSWYRNDLKKKGLNPPPAIGREKIVKEAPAVVKKASVVTPKAPEVVKEALVAAPKVARKPPLDADVPVHARAKAKLEAARIPQAPPLTKQQVALAAEMERHRAELARLLNLTPKVEAPPPPASPSLKGRMVFNNRKTAA